MDDYQTASGSVPIGRTNVSVFEAKSHEKTSVAYGAGLQLNPIPNVAVDVAYEYSDLGDKAKVGTFVVGVGYRF
ncbi:Ail/Lom family outer membrane beta-barrel protein [Photorhabdus viridis]|uniref:Ail/Lom family outer membrane beta-barrel protein n=1 Tax=Photorhabdus viridis TaxID=3163327 RepID=UPI00387E57ED